MKSQLPRDLDKWHIEGKVLFVVYLLKKITIPSLKSCLQEKQSGALKVSNNKGNIVLH